MKKKSVAQSIQIIDLLLAEIGHGISYHVLVIEMFSPFMRINGTFFFYYQFLLSHIAYSLTVAFFMAVVPALAVISGVLVFLYIFMKLGKHVTGSFFAAAATVVIPLSIGGRGPFLHEPLPLCATAAGK
jgi:hypothetical protein